MFHTWLHHLFNPKSSMRTRRRRTADPRILRFKPRIDSLEDRMVPALHIWSGAVSSSWVDAKNWSFGGSPFGDPAPTVVFPAAAAGHTVDLNSPAPQPIALMEFDGSGYQILGPQSLVFQGNTEITTTNTAGTNTVAVTIEQEPASLAGGLLFDHVYNVAGAGTMDIAGKVTGTAVANLLDKTGTGTLRLATPSDYGGATAVHAGRLLMGGNSILPAGTAVTLDSGAVFDLGGGSERIGSLAGAGTVVLNGQLFTGDNNTSTTFTGMFVGAGLLVKEGTGAFTLTAPNAYTGVGLAINAGTVRLSTANVLSGAQAVQVAAGATLDLQNNPQTLQALSGNGAVLLGTANVTVFSSHAIGGTFGSFNGVLSGTGALTKNSPATLTLSGPNTYTGPTLVQMGTLEVNGSLASGVVTVQAGATLAGTGSVKQVNVTGTVSPGSALPGTLHATGVGFVPGSAFQVRLNSPVSFDQLNATGPVNLGGAPTLKVALNFVPAVGQKFTILQSTAGVFGTFKGLPNHAVLSLNGHLFEIIYSPTSVVLQCVV